MMRRLPRPHRPIEHLQSLRPSIAQRPTCQSRLAQSGPCLAQASSFSSTPYPLAGGIFSSKPDKKKHQAFVRRWQKRLLGEAEPVGAHVDPYDKTSPVRIAPEEQGEEEELLEEMESSEEWEYTEAKSAKGLERIGSDAWVLQWQEWQQRDNGVWRDWREEDGFAPVNKISSPAELTDAFYRALVEVLTLQKAGLPLSQSSAASLPIVDIPWIKDVKLRSEADGTISLVYPTTSAMEALVLTLTPSKEIQIPTSAGSEIMSALGDFARKTPEEIAELPDDEAVLHQTLIDGVDRIHTVDMTLDHAQSVLSETREAELRAKLEAAAQAIPADNTVQEQPRLSQIPLTDPELKFALHKRIIRLTGQRISDAHLSQIRTFSDFYHELLDTAKPKPKKLFEQIVQDKKKSRILEIPNVKFSPRRVTVVDKEKEVGRWKVIEYALAERGLPVTIRN